MQFALWPDGALGNATDDVPTLTVCPAANPTGGIVVVCPGGAYAMLADHEAEPVAERLAAGGVTGVVLRYRLGPNNHHPAMLDDAAEAVRVARRRAGEWGASPDKVGILGFSAGGHLASTLSTHFPDDASRPDAAVLIYPVISLLPQFGHDYSRLMLLGENPDPALVESLSNETQVTARTPPTWLLHTVEDSVACENSLHYVLALRRAGVPCELHLYERGPHGYGLAADNPSLSRWPDLCLDWLHAHGF